MHIVLIEPDRVLAETYRQALQGASHSVTMCASAQSAVFAADEQCPDLVIAELQLIGHSGIEFLYEFRSYNDWKSVPVILHTHVPPGEFAGSWQTLKGELGVHHYLYKPVTTLQAMLRTVRELAPA